MKLSTMMWFVVTVAGIGLAIVAAIYIGIKAATFAVFLVAVGALRFLPQAILPATPFTRKLLTLGVVICLAMIGLFWRANVWQEQKKKEDTCKAAQARGGALTKECVEILSAATAPPARVAEPVVDEFKLSAGEKPQTARLAPGRNRIWANKPAVVLSGDSKEYPLPAGWSSWDVEKAGALRIKALADETVVQVERR